MAKAESKSKKTTPPGKKPDVTVMVVALDGEEIAQVFRFIALAAGPARAVPPETCQKLLPLMRGIARSWLLFGKG
jgi:hypothetical protein